MQGQKEEASALGAGDEHGAERRAAREVEGPLRLAAGERQGHGLAALLGQGAEVDDRQPGLGRRLNLLPGLAGQGDEHRGERRVPGGEARQRQGQATAAERPVERPGSGDVVRGVAGLEAIQEPQPLLREGERLRPRGRAARQRVLAPRRAAPAGGADPLREQLARGRRWRARTDGRRRGRIGSPWAERREARGALVPR